MTRLDGRTALVTGGSRGVGAAVVRRLAAEGAAVAFTYTSSADKAESVVADVVAAGGRAVAYRVDQADTGEASSLPGRVIEDLGRLDILVHNAAVYVTGTVDDPGHDAEALARQLAVNVVGVAATTRGAAPVLSDGARIVVISSVAAIQSMAAAGSDYAASKAALEAYARGWARDLGRRGITSNIVQLGTINTDMNPETTEGARTMAGLLPLGRYGQPHEVAGVVAFLAGEDSSFVTGATIRVDGGLLA
ncbi:SDR family oxidoreductase [Streptomyces sp. NBC_00178]|uniref:SDR family NAD(P)-dependent oxidoreductase n=1 Tax=Streptomyces sp. NBC_00178 TaxID=2975672 RepID=UPI002E2D7E77|nr:SDR family oxidoreductase [Streptomyces sp. NBC_00178]